MMWISSEKIVMTWENYATDEEIESDDFNKPMGYKEMWNELTKHN